MSDAQQKGKSPEQSKENSSIRDSIVDYFLPQQYKDAIANRTNSDKVDKAKLEVDLADIRPFILSLLCGCFAGCVILFFHSSFIPNNFLDIIFRHYFGESHELQWKSDGFTQYTPHYVLNTANNLVYLTHVKVQLEPIYTNFQFSSDLLACENFSENCNRVSYVDLNNHIGIYGALRRALIYLVFETPPIVTFLTLIAYSKGKVKKERAVIYVQLIIAFTFFILTFVSGGIQSASLLAFLCQISCLGKSFGKQALSRLSVIGAGFVLFFWYFQSEIPTIPYTIPWLHNFDICERLLAVAFIYMNTHEFFEEIEFMNSKLKVLLEESESNSAKSVFLATISHEMRTPLLHVQVINNLLIDGIQELRNKTVSAKDIEENLSLIHQSLISSEMLMVLIDDVLDFGKMQSHSLSIKNENVSVLHILQKAQKMCEKTALAKELHLRTIISEQSEHTKANLDPKRFLQVLINLIGNAMKFTPKGGKVEIEMDITTRNFCEICLIKVIDTGIGIKKEDLSSIFKPFVQVEDIIKTKREYGGSGLGLSISQSLMKCMKGNVFVTSKYGSGSTFIIEFPIISIQKHNFGRFCDPSSSSRLKCIFDTNFNGDGDNDFIINVADVNIRDSSNKIRHETNTFEVNDSAFFKMESNSRINIGTENRSNDNTSSNNNNIDNVNDNNSNDSNTVNNRDDNSSYGIQKLTPLKILPDDMSSKESSKDVKSDKRRKDVISVEYSNIISEITPPTLLESSRTSPSLISVELKKPKKKSKKLKDAWITIVDDNKINCLLVEKLMKVHGAMVNHFTSGLDALKSFEEVGLPEILILDIYMPEIDGFEMATAVRNCSFKRFEGKEPYILGLSASTLEADRSKSLEVGMNRFVQKPFKNDYLLNVLCKAKKKT